MSYILDALQRADAERARGGVPTLNARPIASAPMHSGLYARQRTGLVIAVVSVLGAAAAAWWLWWPSPSLAPAPQMPLPAPTPAIAASINQTTPPPIAAVPVAPAAPSAATRPPVAKTAAPAMATEPATPAQPKAKTVAVAPEPPAPAATPAPLLAELPEATRRQIPAMAISGAVYSENPAQRLLLVNGQVLNQGSQVAPDLTVVEIRSNMSEFSFRGTRFRLAH